MPPEDRCRGASGGSAHWELPLAHSAAGAPKNAEDVRGLPLGTSHYGYTLNAAAAGANRGRLRAFAAPVQGGDRASRPGSLRRHTSDTLCMSNRVYGRAAASSEDQHLSARSRGFKPRSAFLRGPLHGRGNAYHGSALPTELRGRGLCSVAVNPTPRCGCPHPRLTGGPYRAAPGRRASCSSTPPHIADSMDGSAQLQPLGRLSSSLSYLGLKIFTRPSRTPWRGGLVPLRPRAILRAGWTTPRYVPALMPGWSRTRGCSPRTPAC
jgi:hypothetical protein